MNQLKNRIRPDWHRSLQGVLSECERVRGSAVLAFDLDSTLFDNRPRQARIIREFGAAEGLGPLGECRAAHFDSGWDLKAPLRNLGLSTEEVETLFPKLRAFWLERFFTSEYCRDDEPVPGAPEFVKKVSAAGAVVAYVTGRHEPMRAGTVEALRRFSFPEPVGSGPVHLVMKPAFDVSDDAFKRTAHARVRALGRLLAAFDNEPTHANDYRRTFPEATVIHLCTDHSGRPVDLLEGIVSVPHFRF